MKVIRLGADDATRYRELMLEAYALHPDAFTSTAAERGALALSWWQARLGAGPEPLAVALGVEADGNLVGTVALSFEARDKKRHKATLIGMYVRESFRKLGAGSALVEGVLAAARARPEIVLVQLTVSNHNLAAKNLYRRHGFVEFGVEPYAMRVGDGYVDKCHMWRSLGATLPARPTA